MNRASPVDLRLALEMAHSLAKAEVESGCLLLHPTDKPPTFNGVELEVID